MIYRHLLLNLLLMLAASCSETKLIKITGTKEASNIIINQAKEVIVEVHYEAGAEPYTGAISSGIDAWDILESNLGKIYEGKQAAGSIFVPRILSEMTEIPTQNKSEWTSEDLYELSQNYLISTQTSERVIFVVVFVNGFLAENGIKNVNTVGVSIGNSRVIAIFKDVVTNSANAPTVQKFMEQSTLVHEIGHAIGLVNRGITLTTEHQDEQHGSHCTNSDCVMFWLNEGASEMALFINNFLSTSSIVLYGQECLDDIKAF